MTRAEFDEIFKNTGAKWDGDNAFKGLKILVKYTDNLIVGADHDVIYSIGVDDLIERGITQNDCHKLRKLNWMINDDYYLACFV